MKKMDISSAFALKRVLKAELKAFQDIQAICEAELKNVHPDDEDVKAILIKERDIAFNTCLSLMEQLDDHQKDIVLSKR